MRGGFLLIDDLHGERDWAVFEAAIKRVFPDRPIVEIPDDDPLMHVFFDLDKSMGIPGDRHLRIGPGGNIFARMEGPPHWRGIYNDHNQLMVAVDFNSDMGGLGTRRRSRISSAVYRTCLQVRNQLRHLRNDALEGGYRINVASKYVAAGFSPNAVHSSFPSDEN
jgi:hypothetical protein